MVVAELLRQVIAAKEIIDRGVVAATKNLNESFKTGNVFIPGVSAKVIVGGAPVNARVAQEIGADGYGRVAAEAIDVAKMLAFGAAGN